jgi:hypothetical protein
LREGSSRWRRQRRAACARVALALLGPAALAGCGTVSSLFSSSAPSESGPPPSGAACTNAVILHPLAQTAVFAPGAARQPMGVAFYGVLSEVDGRCEVAGGALHASLDVVVIGERGPSARGGDGVDLQYFVAVTGAGQAVLSKRSFPVRIAIPADAKRAGVTDHIEEMIPLAGQSPGDLSIVLGFQQSPEVVDFYRHFRGR